MMANAVARISVDMDAIVEAGEEIEALLAGRVVPESMMSALEALFDGNRGAEVALIGGRLVATPSAELTALIFNMRQFPLRNGARGG